MNVGYRQYVYDYIDKVDGMGKTIDIALLNNISIYIEKLTSDVLTYIHENFPTILISADEINNRIKNIYIIKTNVFKSDINYRVAGVKYDLNGSYSLNKIKDFMDKNIEELRICFNSVKCGSNLSFKDTVLNISSDIFGFIQRSSNNNLSFAKKTGETQSYINKLVLKSYIEFMSAFGNTLIEEGINKSLVKIYENILSYDEESITDDSIKSAIDEYNKDSHALAV